MTESVKYDWIEREARDNIRSSLKKKVFSVCEVNEVKPLANLESLR